MFVSNWIGAHRRAAGFFGLGTPSEETRKDGPRNPDLPWIRGTIRPPSRNQSELPQKMPTVAAPRKAVTPFLVAAATEESAFRERPGSLQQNTSTDAPTHRLASRAALRVIRVVDAAPAHLQAANDGSPSSRLAGRMRLSGRACDVRAELERMAA